MHWKKRMKKIISLHLALALGIGAITWASFQFETLVRAQENQAYELEVLDETVGNAIEEGFFMLEGRSNQEEEWTSLGLYSLADPKPIVLKTSPLQLQWKPISPFYGYKTQDSYKVKGSKTEIDFKRDLEGVRNRVKDSVVDFHLYTYPPKPSMRWDLYYISKPDNIHSDSIISKAVFNVDFGYLFAPYRIREDLLLTTRLTKDDRYGLSNFLLTDAVSGQDGKAQIVNQPFNKWYILSLYDKDKIHGINEVKQPDPKIYVRGPRYINRKRNRFVYDIYYIERGNVDEIIKDGYKKAYQKYLSSDYQPKKDDLIELTHGLQELQKEKNNPTFNELTEKMNNALKKIENNIVEKSLNKNTQASQQGPKQGETIRKEEPQIDPSKLQAITNILDQAKREGNVGTFLEAISKIKDLPSGRKKDELLAKAQEVLTAIQAAQTAKATQTAQAEQAARAKQAELAEKLAKAEQEAKIAKAAEQVAKTAQAEQEAKAAKAAQEAKAAQDELAAKSAKAAQEAKAKQDELAARVAKAEQEAKATQTAKAEQEAKAAQAEQAAKQAKLAEQAAKAAQAEQASKAAQAEQAAKQAKLAEQAAKAAQAEQTSKATQAEQAAKQAKLAEQAAKAAQAEQASKATQAEQAAKVAAEQAKMAAEQAAKAATIAAARSDKPLLTDKKPSLADDKSAQSEEAKEYIQKYKSLLEKPLHELRLRDLKPFLAAVKDFKKLPWYAQDELHNEKEILQKMWRAIDEHAKELNKQKDAKQQKEINAFKDQYKGLLGMDWRLISPDLKYEVEIALDDLDSQNPATKKALNAEKLHLEGLLQAIEMRKRSNEASWLQYLRQEEEKKDVVPSTGAAKVSR